MKIGAGVCGAIAAEANVCCWVTGSKRVAMVAGVKHTLHQVRGSLYGAGMVTLAFSEKMSQLIGKYVYFFFK